MGVAAAGAVIGFIVPVDDAISADGGIVRKGLALAFGQHLFCSLYLSPPISPLALVRSLFDGRGRGLDKDAILDESRATRDERPS
jgi:hypothetical protein